MMIRKSYIFATIFFFFSVQIFAEPQNNGDPSSPESLPSGKGILEQSFDSFVETRTIISEQIYDFSDSLDSFFGDDNIEEGNGSRIRISLSTKFGGKGEQVSDAGIATILLLPKTQEKFQLVIQDIQKEVSSEEENEKEVQGDDKLQETNEESILAAALRYVFIDTDAWKVQADSGIHLKIPLEPFAKLKIRRNIRIEKWVLKLIQNFKWNTSKGWGESSTILFDRRLSKTVRFRFSNDASWYVKEDLIHFGHALILYHHVSEKDSLNYFTGIKAIDKPKIHLTSYNFGAAYRRKLYQNWLYLQITPVIAFPRSEDFRNTPSITFKLETIFGGK
ncbi:MAG: hypothetical protein HQM13_00420 [SAR324 cluster bacterium]|nr:hypothetical protein [SAR324 cluster bacterium]